MNDTSDNLVPYGPSVIGENVGASGGNFHLLGWTTLTLNDAKPKAGIYDLYLSPNGTNWNWFNSSKIIFTFLLLTS